MTPALIKSGARWHAYEMGIYKLTHGVTLSCSGACPTYSPTPAPTHVPTSGPTWSPSTVPTLQPTNAPTSTPTKNGFLTAERHVIAERHEHAVAKVKAEIAAARKKEILLFFSMIAAVLIILSIYFGIKFQQRIALDQYLGSERKLLNAKDTEMQPATYLSSGHMASLESHSGLDVETEEFDDI